MIKVVVVEDEELVRKGIVLTMDWASMGCVVVGEAANGKEGMEVILRHAPDLIITDIRMPVMDGVEMIQKLREAGSDAEFILLTAYSDFEYAHSAIKLGVSDYLLKPFVDGELEKAVDNAGRRLEQKRRTAPEAPILRFNQKKGDKSKLVELAIEYIAEHYADPGMSVAQAAEHLEISEGYLSRVFKKETDYTFNAYLTRYRIHTAMELLRDCRVRVYEVAGQVGYLDTTYFSTLFKRYTNLSPSEYQDRCN